ncbi:MULTISPECIES: ABC transporter ATP-binding protein [unclassified Microbacterium]|uniref:ATP-binding cassette domain-containing protein n=1 Tax=unclassified Microbacterium TaxID=2609290 RepID=UPI000CFA8293|nr:MULTISPECIES: ABC transporter ATP-binding protein [unclassified Microbacterium]PQZ60548.1 ABC transporter ATP-binding protein [Microbacterium sp. MYb43]PQZ81974.1 ABC transporter ATP-binding protein [Microbacterium sp. MYb40]PRB22237.1 ABC transporter ATP-binding protein [Microbacterium sp. MYb54]PRB31198.1 ABC transporter ATP-binding protein [Microbacterium sp. MYb50]PRB69807.1 ABC transporter ATP-binding protein [Microbacterium sp. MYb24]
MSAALEIQGLRIAFDATPVVDGVSFAVERGECVAIVGESGAGKTLTARALLGLVPREAAVTLDRLVIDGTDASGLAEREWRQLRGAGIALVSQDALVSLDPLRRIGAEVAEPLTLHRMVRGRVPTAARVRELLERVWMPEPDRRARQHPHELSGGLRQRALIASALAAAPAVLVADEPTTALDATVQARILGLLREITAAGTALVFISHDFAAVRRVADRVIVMKGGAVIESGPVSEVLENPQQDYTKQLIAATIHEPRSAAESAPAPVLVAADLSKTFDGVPAIIDASFTVSEGQTLGIVGESGSGKTTLARMIVGVEAPDSGALRWTGTPRVQLVHQNPLGAFDPRWTIGRSLREGLEAGGVPRARRGAMVAELLAEVGLAPELADRRPSALSGGQRQRAAIARALAADPEVLVLDEPVSALDPSVRERVLRLLARLQQERRLTMILVSHDLDVVGAVADEVLVMQDGRIVEQGVTADVFAAPQHPFTRELLEASGPVEP